MSDKNKENLGNEKQLNVFQRTYKIVKDEILKLHKQKENIKENK